jgi:hypothetical protein
VCAVNELWLVSNNVPVTGPCGTALALQGWWMVHNILQDIVQEVQMSTNDSPTLVESGSQPSWLACSSVRICSSLPCTA